jgi:hypothetical protein
MGVAAAERELVLSAAESAADTRIAVLSAELAETGATVSSSTIENGVPVAVYITRFDSTLYWVVAAAGPARQGSAIAARVGFLVRAQSAADGSITANRITERWWSELY